MSSIVDRLVDVLRDEVGAILGKSIVTLAVTRAKVDDSSLKPGDRRRLLAELERGFQLFVRDLARQRRCLELVGRRLSDEQPVALPNQRVVIDLNSESDIVKARGLGRDRCRELGFSGAVQIKVATAISELARNVMQYAGEGRVTINTIEEPRSGIEVVVADDGPGITELDRILSGDFRSRSGMGIGLVGTRNLMDECEIRTEPGQGTVVTVRKFLG